MALETTATFIGHNECFGLGKNALAFGRSLCGFYGNRDICSIHLNLITEVLSQSFYRAFGEVGTAIHQSEKHTVNLQVRIDTLLNS